jgi:hypothetical protein
LVLWFEEPDQIFEEFQRLIKALGYVNTLIYDKKEWQTAPQNVFVKLAPKTSRILPM